MLHQGDYTSIPEWVRTRAVDFGFVNPHAVKGMETTIIKSGEFRAVLPIEPVIMRTMSIVAKGKNTLPLASKEFIRFLMEYREAFI